MIYGKSYEGTFYVLLFIWSRNYDLWNINVEQFYRKLPGDPIKTIPLFGISGS